MNFLLGFGLFSGAFAVSREAISFVSLISCLSVRWKPAVGRFWKATEAEVALEKETDRLIFEALIEIASHYNQPTPPYRNPPRNSWPY